MAFNYIATGKMGTSKHSYLSPANGMLDITVIRDARPYALISLDLGIPNFTVFSIKFPLVEDKPNSMSGLVAEAVHVLLDEMSAFMISAGYRQEVIVRIYAAVLACFKGMTGEADTNKSMSAISKDPTVKVFEGTFKLPLEFINETYDKVVTASSGKNIKRPPAQRHLELTYDKPLTTNVNDARKVIRNFRSRSLKTQPNPMYIIVYDMMGNPRGTIPLGGAGFKNNLLNAIYSKGKKAGQAPEFTPTVKFDNDVEMKTTNAEGIPKSIFVGDEQYAPYAYISDDMALYASEKREWVVKFVDGRCVAFADFPSVEELKEGNYPVPTTYTRWTLLSKNEVPESSDLSEAVDEQGNEVIEPSETEVNPTTDLKPDDEKNEQQQDKDKTAAFDKVALNIPRLVKDFGAKLQARYAKERNPPRYGTKAETAEQIINQISSYDTTPNKEYTAWIVGQYARGGNPAHPDKGIKRFEDIQSRVIPALKRFDELKRSKKLLVPERDITKYQGIRDLEDIVDKYSDVDATSNRQLEVSQEQAFFDKKEATLFFNSPQVKVIIPHTEEASCFFGLNTKWCTAATGGRNYFSSYDKDGPLYIVLFKAQNERYQFHLHSGQYMDERDQQINTWDLVAKYPILKQIFSKVVRDYNAEVELNPPSSDDGMLERFAFIENPTPEELMKAVQLDGRIIQHFPEASEEIRFAAMNQQLGLEPSSYDPVRKAYIVGKWKDVDEFAQENGNYTAKWCAGLSTGDSNFDIDIYDEHENMHSALEACKPETLAKVMEYLKFHHKDEMIEYLADTDNDDWNDDEYARENFPELSWDAREIADFIQEKDLDEERDFCLNAWRNAQEAGAEEEAVDALKNAVLALRNEGTDYGTSFDVPDADTGFWDGEVVELLTFEQAEIWRKEAPDQENLWEYYASDRGATLDVAQPYYGWSGWDESVADDRIGEEFYISETDREAARQAVPPPLFDQPEALVEKTSVKKRRRKKSHFDEKGYWVGEGGGASGILPVCTSTGRICLAWRAAEVNQGNCWGTIGGGLQPEMNPAESARMELMEETGFKGAIRLIPAFVFVDSSFKYHNFIGLVATEFGLNPMEGGSAKLQFEDETDAIEWFTLADIMDDMKSHAGDFHSGLRKLFVESADLIRKVVEAASNKGKEE